MLVKYVVISFISLFACLAVAANDEESAVPKAVDATTSDPPQRIEIIGTALPKPPPMTTLSTAINRVVVGQLPNLGGREGGSMPEASKPMGSAPAQDNSDKNKDDQTTCHPVILTTGEKFKEEADFSSSGLYGISLIRTYRSRTNGGQLFSNHWLSSLDGMQAAFSADQLCDGDHICTPSTLTITETDGTQHLYATSLARFGIYTSNNATSLGTFTRSSNTLYRDKKYYAFTQNGYLTSISSSGVRLLTFNRNPDNTLASVVSAGGQSVSFTWTNGLVTKIKDPNGKYWLYGYANNMLKTVTSPGDSPDVRTYYYEDSNDSTLLTGIAINGVGRLKVEVRQPASCKVSPNGNSLLASGRGRSRVDPGPAADRPELSSNRSAVGLQPLHDLPRSGPRQGYRHGAGQQLSRGTCAVSYSGAPGGRGGW